MIFHLGTSNNFVSKSLDASSSTFDRLMGVILDRKANPPPRSYTNTLLDAGHPKIAAKIMEEAGEVVEAAAEPGPDGAQHLVREAADLVYHLWVMLAWR